MKTLIPGANLRGKIFKRGIYNEERIMKKYAALLKKILVLCLVFCVITGCSAPSVDVPEDTEIEDSDDEDKDDDDGGKDNDEDDNGKEDDTPVETVSDGETLLLSRRQTSDIIYLMDESGNIVKTISRRDLAENISESDLSQYRVYNETESQILGSDAEGIRSQAVCEGSGFIFFSDYRYSDKENAYTRMVYAISENEHKLYQIWDGPRDSYFATCDYYDGRFYIDYTLGYDDDGNYLGLTEKCFAYDDATDSFVQEETGIDDVIQAANNAGLRLNGASSSSSDPVSYRRTLDECGFICGTKDDGYYMINARGKIAKLLDYIDDAYLQYYGPDIFIYESSSYERGTSSLNILDIKTKTSYQLTEEWPAAGFLGRDGWKYYYYYQTCDEYGINVNHVYEYNYMNGETTPLYEAQTIPGSGISSPGVEEFRVFGGRVYTIDLKDGEIRWVSADITNGRADLQDIGCPSGKVDIFEYGTVDHYSAESCCEECGTALHQKYTEFFVLDDEYSSNADKINNALNEKAQAFISSIEGDVYDSPCEDHQEHPAWYRVTEDINVSEVNIIDDRYLAVNMSGYWYGGGAHGMPMRNQYLFDLETGEELFFTDFYTGTEEEFKTLIAEKTVEDCERYGDFAPYYDPDDLDQLYEDAYNYAWLGENNIEFTDDGIIYYYTPYQMGPYAAGYIEFTIFYVELFNRGTLAER